MRTAQKALALVMAFALAFSMMAGAAFTDSSSIDTLDAVNTLSALGIIAGFPDGSFKPDQIVTRAEMAKMIYVLKNAGRDDGAVYFKSSVNAFYDVKGHWAEGYVNYAYSLGIIAGKGNGIFDPDAAVTGLEAAKMLLVVLGYKAETEGLVGSQWAIKTAALAQSSHLFDKYAAGLGEGAPRQFAAQMIANALDAAIIQYNSDGVAETQYDSTNKAITLGSRTVSTKTVEGILEANEYYAYNATSGVGDGKISFKAEGATTAAVFNFDAADELVGQKVKVMYKDDDSTTGLSSSDTVVGVAALSSNDVVTFTKGDIDTETIASAATDEIKMKTTGTKYKIATYIYFVQNNYGNASTTQQYAALKNNSADTITLIDSNADGYYDVVKVMSKVFTRVTAVGTENIGFLDGGNLKIADNTFYSGIAKDDFVFVTRNYIAATVTDSKHNVVEKATATTAKLGGRNSAGDLYVNGAYVSVDKAAIGTYAKAKVDFFWDRFTAPDPADYALNDTPALDKDLDIYMNGKYWVAAKGVASSDKYCVLTDVETSGFSPAGKILFSDGTKGTYTLQEGKLWVGDNKVAPATLESVSGKTPDKNMVYKYTINSSNEIKLTLIVDKATLTYDKDKETVTGVGAAKVFTDTSVIFVKNTTSGADPVWKAYSFADIRDTAIGASTTAAEYVTKDSTFKLATFYKVDGINAGGSGLTYGFLTANPDVMTSGDDYIVTYKIWDGTTTLTKTLNAGSSEPNFSGKATKGDYVSFKNKANGLIVEANGTSAILPDLTTLHGRIYDVIGSSVGVGVGSDITSTGFYIITSDTTIIFVNSKDDKAGEGSDITVFDSTLGTSKFNAKFVVDSTTDNELEVLFVDVNSDILPL
jgi:hypothetical protein